jgi:hypothetical protein
MTPRTVEIQNDLETIGTINSEGVRWRSIWSFNWWISKLREAYFHDTINSFKGFFVFARFK